MITVSSAEFQRNFGAYQDKALLEPVAITRNGRERIVVLSADEYHRLKRLREADLAASAGAEMAPQRRRLDDELK